MTARAEKKQYITPAGAFVLLLSQKYRQRPKMFCFFCSFFSETTLRLSFTSKENLTGICTDIFLWFFHYLRGFVKHGAVLSLVSQIINFPKLVFLPLVGTLSLNFLLNLLFFPLRAPDHRSVSEHEYKGNQNPCVCMKISIFFNFLWRKGYSNWIFVPMTILYASCKKVNSFTHQH